MCETKVMNYESRDDFEEELDLTAVPVNGRDSHGIQAEMIGLEDLNLSYLWIQLLHPV